jgi:hypothetical protein
MHLVYEDSTGKAAEVAAPGDPGSFLKAFFMVSGKSIRAR